MHDGVNLLLFTGGVRDAHCRSSHLAISPIVPSPLGGISIHHLRYPEKLHTNTVRCWLPIAARPWIQLCRVGDHMYLSHSSLTSATTLAALYNLPHTNALLYHELSAGDNLCLIQARGHCSCRKLCHGRPRQYYLGWNCREHRGRCRCLILGAGAG